MQKSAFHIIEEHRLQISKCTLKIQLLSLKKLKTTSCAEASSLHVGGVRFEFKKTIYQEKPCKKTKINKHGSCIFTHQIVSTKLSPKTLQEIILNRNNEISNGIFLPTKNYYHCCNFCIPGNFTTKQCWFG